MKERVSTAASGGEERKKVRPAIKGKTGTRRYSYQQGKGKTGNMGKEGSRTAGAGGTAMSWNSPASRRNEYLETIGSETAGRRFGVVRFIMVKFDSEFER